MKKTYLFIFLCCIANINIFAAENKKELPRTFSLEEIDNLILRNQKRLSGLNTEINKTEDLIQQLKDDEINRLIQFDNDFRLKHTIEDKK